jgi:dipeptidase E
MKLFLASEAKHPTSFKELTTFVEGWEGKRVAYIPTAANGEYWGSWKDGGSIKVIQTLPAQVDIIELESSYYQDVLAKIEGADVVWMAGGMTGYLLYWIRRVQLDKVLPDWLNNGMIYVGSSAGSMVCSQTQTLLDWYIGEVEPGASVLPGLGLVDFEIYPHYEDHLLDQIQQGWHQGTLYLLKNGEAVKVVDGEVSIFGEERKIVK